MGLSGSKPANTNKPATVNTNMSTKAQNMTGSMPPAGATAGPPAGATAGAAAGGKRNKPKMGGSAMNKPMMGGFNSCKKTMGGRRKLKGKSTKKNRK